MDGESDGPKGGLTERRPPPRGLITTVSLRLLHTRGLSDSEIDEETRRAGGEFAAILERVSILVRQPFVADAPHFSPARIDNRYSGLRPRAVIACGIERGTSVSTPAWSASTRSPIRTDPVPPTT